MISTFRLALALLFCILSIQPAPAQQAGTTPLSALAVPAYDEISIPEKPHYFGPESAVAGVFGLVGGLAVSGKVDDTRTMIKGFMEKNDIDIRRIVIRQFQEQIDQSPAELRLPEAALPAKFRLTIRSYGISHKMVFSKDYKPWLRLQLDLLDKDGNSIWDETSFINNLTSETPGYPFQHYFEDPEVLKDALDKAAALAVKEVLQQFTNKYAVAAP